VGPGVGEDAAIVQENGKVLVIHSDPITGAVKDLGRLAVHISVNDVVSKGADPRWISLVLLLHTGVKVDEIRRIALQTHEACVEVGAAIVGGHTEVTPIVERDVIVSTVVGEAPRDRFFTSSGASPGDSIVMTKTAAIEGTWILSNQFPKLRQTLGDKVMRRARLFVQQISVYPEARVARAASGVTAMHDVTEGGVLCAVQEIASASGCGFIIDSSKVAVADETHRICAALDLDPLKTIGSGSLIITTKASQTAALIRSLDKHGIRASEIGSIRKEGKWLRDKGANMKVPDFVREEIWTVVKD